ncbi:MAG: acyl-CoA dehydratase activase [Desulfatiglandales bacterium]
MITAGVDIGSLTANVVVLDDDNLLAWSIIPTGPDSPATAKKAMDKALSKTDLSLGDIEYVVATGYGRVVVPYSHRNITEISCHAKGAHWFFPKVRSVLDMGGQDCKAIKCDENGKVTSFVMNDKCAAGTGRFMEIVAKAMDLPLSDVGRLSLEVVERSATISAMCAVFAKTEIISLLRQGTHKNDILAGTCEAVAKRTWSLLEKVGVEEEFVITGGIAKNIGIVRRLEDRLGVKAQVAFEPQIVGALGAARFAKEILSQEEKRSSAGLSS